MTLILETWWRLAINFAPVLAGVPAVAWWARR